VSPSILFYTMIGCAIAVGVGVAASPGCSTNIAPAIVVATPRDCAVACAHLDACACEETCDRISQSGFLAADLACIAAASSCDAVRACGVAQTASP
jgi:hypothetical protein